MAQPAVNMQQLMEMMAQLIQNQAANHPAPQNQPAIVPPLPDVIPFEHSMDNRSRITEWIERFNFSLDCAAPDLADDLKVKALMNKLSESAFSEYSRFILPSKVTDFTFKVTTEKLEKLFAKQQSVFIDRFECLRAEKEENESFRDFVNRHKRLLRDFDFANMNEEQFKTLMLLLALKAPKDAVLRQKILAKLTTDNDITYDGVVEECLAFLATIMESKMVESQPIKNVNMVKNGKNPWKGKANKNSKPQSNEKQSNSGQSCWRCGRNHQPKDCQFKDAICNQCNQKGHLKKRCEAIKEWRRLHPFKGNKDKLNKNVGIVNISAIHKKINSTNLLRIEILLNNKPIEFILDSGAEVNVIDERSWKAIGQPKISKCVEKGRVYDGTQKEFMGKGMGTFEFQGFKTDQEFFVAKNGMMNLLSVTTMDEFGLLDHIKQRISSKEINAVIPPNVERKNSKEEPNAEFIPKEFPNIFKEELGHCTKVKAHLTLNNNATPIFRRARPVPYNVKEVVDKELDRLESMGVIEKIEHANWAAPILVVKKANGSARMCIDFSTGLNEALLSNKHPLPVPEDIFATLNGGKYFSQLDLRDAYFQIELDEDSQKLCCIATHRGLYKLTRLPFGVKTAPSIFQSIMDAMLSGLPFACAYLDDIIIVGRTIEEHKNNIREVLKRIESYGFRLKLEKCSFFKKEIKYLGVIINEMGRKPDPEKIKAIAKMPAPHDIATLRSFLGMVNHYQQFVQNMRFIRKPMDDLLRKDSKWNWDENCIKAFTKIKEILSSNLLLTHYDPAQQIIVAADASENGIGAVIKHRFPDGTEKAIAHASSALTPAEKNYSQIEKEGLALIFAIQKFHKMIYGRHFILQTDHRPLLSIFGNKKGIRQCSANRLLRWSLILLAYDFSIEYVNTTEFGEADALSRLIARAESGENDRVIASLEAENDYDVMIENTSKIFPLKFDDLVSETAKENLLQKVIKFVKNGWPNPKQIPNESEQIQLFYRRKDELTVHKGCLMYAERLVIPTIFQKCVLEILHKGHPGVKRMKQLARQYVYWPKLDSQIENFVKNCEPCQSVLRAPVKTHLHSWPKPLGPWDRVHVDYAGPFFGKDFLIIVDAFSKYPEVFEMPTKSSKATIEKLRYLFTRHGLPHTLVSDNGTQFTSSEFVKFMAANGITHLKSAPYNPMSNGQAERFVDTFKRSFKKMKGEGKMDSRIIETFLVSYRTTPNDSLENNKSPAELFLGRRPRTALDLLKPPPLIPNERNEAMEKQFNRRFGTRVRTFAVGDKVFAKHRLSQSWKTGIINKRNGVIYEVIFPNGTSNRFHANQLRERHTKDNEDENNLMVFYELFKLPPPPMNEPVIEPEIVVQPDEPIIENEIPVMVENPQPVVIENPRRSQRNRKGTIRYSPG